MCGLSICMVLAYCLFIASCYCSSIHYNRHLPLLFFMGGVNSIKIARYSRMFSKLYIIYPQVLEICIFNPLSHSHLPKNEWMIGVLGHNSALVRLYWAGDNLGEWDEFCYEPSPGAGSIAWPVAQQSSAVPLYYGCLPIEFNKVIVNNNINIEVRLALSLTFNTSLKTAYLFHNHYKHYVWKLNCF